MGPRSVVLNLDVILTLNTLISSFELLVIVQLLTCTARMSRLFPMCAMNTPQLHLVSLPLRCLYHFNVPCLDPYNSTQSFATLSLPPRSTPRGSSI